MLNSKKLTKRSNRNLKKRFMLYGWFQAKGVLKVNSITGVIRRLCWIMFVVVSLFGINLYVMLIFLYSAHIFIFCIFYACWHYNLYICRNLLLVEICRTSYLYFLVFFYCLLIFFRPFSNSFMMEVPIRDQLRTLVIKELIGL